MLQMLWNLYVNEEGQDLAEYALVIALVAVIAVGALTTLGGNISNTLSNIAGNI